METLATLLENLEPLVDATGDLARLQNKILDLAVTGSLLPQDPSEGSGLDALAKVELDIVVRTDTVRRKTLELTEVTEEERPFEVPDSWAWSRLGNIAKFIDYRGRTPVKTSSGVRLITAKNVRMGYVNEEPAEFIAESAFDDWMTRGLPRINDVLFTTEAPLANVALFQFDEPIALAQRTICLSPYDGVTGEYLMRYLMAPIARDVLIKRATGTTVSGIRAAELKRIPIPIPPVEEQDRIVQLLNRFFDLIDNASTAVAERESARRDVSVAALKVLETRSDGSVGLPHLEELIQIPDDVHNLEQAILGMAARGKLTPVDPTMPARTAELEARGIRAEHEGPWELPAHWDWVSLGQLSESVLGKMLDKSKNKGEFRPYMGNTNVRWFEFDLSDLKEMRFEDSEKDRYGLLPGDVIVCEGGEPGRCAVWTDDAVDMRIQKALHRVRCNDLLRPQWLVYVLRCFANDGTLAPLFTGIAIKHLTGASLRKVLIPLPPVDEQDRIVAAIDKLMTLTRLLRLQLAT